MRKIINFNDNWKFHKGADLPAEWTNFGNINIINAEVHQWQKADNHSLSKPENPFPKEWRKITIPHDFVIEGKFCEEAQSRTGALHGDKAWYIKDFKLAKEDKDKRIFIEFDGIYRNSEVYANGHFIGRRLSGYSSMSYDISEVCVFGGDNRIAVFVDATEHELWSYEGGGIYRSVRLVKTDEVHIDHWGLQIIPKNNGEVKVEATVCNDSYSNIKCTLEAKVLKTNAKGTAKLSIDIFEKANAVLKLKVSEPQLWSVDEPNLYTLHVKLKHEGKVLDTYDEKFGFREFNFNPKTGFSLNGEQMKLKGTCCHQDSSGVGVAVPPELQEWRVLRLKSYGCNAIRTSHNMPDPALLDACDKHGMLVMDEVRMPGCAEELICDLTDTIKRDRNHPSVIIWCLGNEEHIQHKLSGMRIFRKMNQLAHSLDSTRPTTYAHHAQWVDNCDFLAENNAMPDVFGMNYRSGQNSNHYDTFHKKHPQVPYLGAETWGGMTSRGLYEPDKSNIPVKIHERWQIDETWESKEYRNYASAYGTTFTPWGYTIEECWQDCVERPEMAGSFFWTGFDYRGETSPYDWPAVITRFGIVDLCGFYKELTHYLKCWWKTEEPHIFLMPHWNWHEKTGKNIRVRCYSNAAEVELKLNSKVISKKKMRKNGKLEWQVPFAAGTLEAIGYDKNGKRVSHTERVTASAPAQLALSSEVIGEVAVINVQIQDKDGNPCPRADNSVEFDVPKSAEILGVGNGNPMSHEPDKFTNKRMAYHGLCQIIIRKTDKNAKVKVKAQSHLLKTAEINV